MTSNAQLQWVRPDNVPFPTVWRKFEAKESKDSDKLVKYTIQDLPEDRFDDAIRHMTEYYLVDHPLTETTNGIVDKDYVEDNQRMWRIVMNQKCCIVCFRENSDEIVGLNLHIVETKNDAFELDRANLCKSKGSVNWRQISKIMYANFSPFDKYNVNQYLDSYGLSVHPTYRRCGIAQHLLEAGKTQGTAFGLKVIHIKFESEQASKIADRVGFKLDLEYTIEELTKIDPTIPYTNEKTNKIAIKTWIINEIGAS